MMATITPLHSLTTIQDMSQQIQSTASDLVLSRYISAAALTWLLYDHVLTFEEERQWIWSNKLTLTKILFLINRYSAPIVILAEVIQYSGRTTLGNDICRVWLFFEALWQSGSALIAQFLLGLRMCAIWGSRPWTKAVLYTGCIICSLASLSSITVGLAHVARSYQYLPAFGVCYTMEPLPSWLWAAFFLPIMAFDLLIFLLTVWNAIIGRSEHIRKGSLTFMMWRDGALYFVVIFASELACVIISAVWGFGTTMIIKFLVWAIQNVVIGHMTLNLVEAVRGPEPDMGPTSFLNMTDHDFTMRPSVSTNTNRRSRKSRIWESTIDINGTASSPITFTKTLPSQPPNESVTNIALYEEDWTHDPHVKAPAAIDHYLGGREVGSGDEPGVDEAQWAEVYRSGKDERTRVAAGSSRRETTQAHPPHLPQESDPSGIIMTTVGTGRSRLLTDTNVRRSILTREDLDDLMGRGSVNGHSVDNSTFGRTAAIWGLEVPVIERAASAAVSSSEGYHPVNTQEPISPKEKEDPVQKKQRLDQLVAALTTPPSPTVPISPASPRRPGFF